jgi:hypothetical protein
VARRGESCVVPLSLSAPARGVNGMIDGDPTQERSNSAAQQNAPSWITPELIERTLRVWQPYYAAPLQPEDAVTMILSVGQLFDSLRRG